MHCCIICILPALCKPIQPHHITRSLACLLLQNHLVEAFHLEQGKNGQPNRPNIYHDWRCDASSLVSLVPLLPLVPLLLASSHVAQKPRMAFVLYHGQGKIKHSRLYRWQDTICSTATHGFAASCGGNANQEIDFPSKLANAHWGAPLQRSQLPARYADQLL